MKLKTVVLASMFMLPLGLLYAQGQSDGAGNANPPGHQLDADGNAFHGQGHERHVGVGNGHVKFDVSPS